MATEDLAVIREYLGMATSPVPVKILREEEAGDPPPRVRSYCDLVRMAAREGKRFVLTAASARALECPNPELVLGFREPRYVEVEPRIRGGTKSVLLGYAERDYDLVLLLLDPRQVMKASVLLGGLTANFKGEMAVCGEATALVYNQGRGNVSFLCYGCRNLSGYADNEVAIGLTAAEVATLAQKIREKLARKVEG